MLAITGGTGMLATELKKLLPNADYFSHRVLEITDESSCEQLEKYDLVVHLAALTDVNWGDKQKDLYYKVNVLGTRNVARHAKKLMYWSTEYVFDGERGDYNEFDTPSPLNYYGLSKLLGEYEARVTDSVVVRTAFKPRPYKHPQVPKEMYSTGGYIDEMAKEFVLAISNFDSLPSTLHIGLKKVRLADFARETREVEEISIKNIPVRLPKDSSLDFSLWKRIKKRL
jgi:dTDP-4-dehydrorhamnose reductase